MLDSFPACVPGYGSVAGRLRRRIFSGLGEMIQLKNWFSLKEDVTVTCAPALHSGVLCKGDCHVLYPNI